MKSLLYIIPALFVAFSCSNSSKNSDKKTEELVKKETIEAPEQSKDTEESQPSKHVDKATSEIPLPDGTYTFDMAFSEWQGQSMGEKVSVVINGNTVKIIYEGGGKMNVAKKGAILEEGLLIKHKSGRWIIGKKESDKDLDEVGGCSGGPNVLDFENKKYWVC